MNAPDKPKIQVRRATAAALAGALALSAAACGGSGGTSGGAATNGTFTAAIKGDPGALDPATAVQTATTAVLRYAYDTLIGLRKDGTLAPQVATSWEVKPSAVTFHIRQGVTCSDGSAVTPDVVASNYRYVADPAHKSPLLGVYVPAGLTATADNNAGTVTLKTPTPFGFLLNSGVNLFLVCGKGLQDRTVLAKGTSGSGLFQLSEAVANDHYTLKRRDAYAWGPGGMTAKAAGVPATVTLKVVTSESTAVNLLASGGINSTTVAGPDRSRMASLPDVKTTTFGAPSSQYFFNQAGGRPGQDLAVRKALASAVDIGQLAKIAGSGTAVAPTGLVSIDPKPCPGDTVAGNRPAYNVAGATAALDAAGWKAGPDGIRVKNGKKLSLRFFYDPADLGGKAAGEYIAAEWKKIGVGVELRGVPSTQATTILFGTGEWEVAWLPIGVSLPTQLMPFYAGPTPPKGTNFAHIQNPQYAKLATQAATLPGAQGCALWNKAEAAVQTNVDVVPVVTPTALLALRGATGDVVAGNLVPQSIRLTA